MPGNKSSASGVSTDESVAWGSITESLVLLAAVKVPGASEIIKIIKELAGVADSQVTMLRCVGRDVQLIRLAPFRTAQEHLETAIRKVEDGGEYQYHLRKAEDYLIEALRQSASLLESSVVQFNLGVVTAARRDEQEAHFRLKQAYDDSVKVTNELCENAAKLSGASSGYFAASLIGGLIAPEIGFVLCLRSLAKVNKSIKITKALQAYTPFAAAAARAFRTVDSKAEIFLPNLDDSGNLKWINLDFDH